MASVPTERAKQWYETHRRENFAASQRLEGIITPATRPGSDTPLPTRAQLLEKYTGRRQR